VKISRFVFSAAVGGGAVFARVFVCLSVVQGASVGLGTGPPAAVQGAEPPLEFWGGVEAPRSGRLDVCRVLVKALT